MTTPAAAQTKLIPRDILFGNPEVTGPSISRDGKQIAYIAPHENVLNVWLMDLDGANKRKLTSDTNRGIRNYFWSYDKKSILYLQDIGGNENWSLYQVNVETLEEKHLTPFKDVQVRIFDLHRDYPNELLVTLNKDNPVLHDVYHLDLTTGELKQIEKNPGHFTGWVSDANFKVVGGSSVTEEGGSKLHLRDEQGEWYDWAEWGPEDSFGLVTFSKDGSEVYLLDSRGANAKRLIRFDVKSREIKEVIAEDSIYDVSGAIVHPETYELQAVSIVKDRIHWIILDEKIEEDFKTMRAEADGDFFLVSRDLANEKWIFGFILDKGPTKYYLYERNTKKTTFLFTTQPKLDEYDLTNMEPISFQSRDGFEVYGYISFPPNVEKKNLPMVLNVHGGPWARDSWGFDSEAQWFANRGYICLQINFRGSIGYGKEFQNAGDREWGRNMHNDLIDAVNWAVEKGYADKDRVAIYGGSYGGYAALVGATLTPDVFKCAVDIVGPSNLITLINSVPEYWKPMIAIFHKRVGNPEKDKDFLLSRSPLSKVDEIKIPMLIAQGKNDPRVKEAEAEQIVAAMKEKGIDHEYALFEDEGHGFAKPENRLKFYAQAEKFLAKHLGGRSE